MLKYVVFSIISFMLGTFVQVIIEIFESKKKFEKIKKLNEQNFSQAMNDLEIK